MIGCLSPDCFSGQNAYSLTPKSVHVEQPASKSSLSATSGGIKLPRRRQKVLTEDALNVTETVGSASSATGTVWGRLEKGTRGLVGRIVEHFLLVNQAIRDKDSSKCRPGIRDSDGDDDSEKKHVRIDVPSEQVLRICQHQALLEDTGFLGFIRDMNEQ
ncbi:unnamed protein product [Protopolystoma xenopodis]|uniref:Uncharacterized protein n=1 Tax=Protopolystoma xenopodis TaxID=117903 RepID=A0A3S5BL02_9PLAT|nr:unnamed protein product [Protopolystoma xenopodis]